MIPERVAAILAAEGLEVLEFEPGSTPTAEAAAARIGVATAQIAKSLLFRIKAGGYLLVVCRGDRRVSSAKLKTIADGKCSMTSAEETEAVTGFKPGGVCPFGLEGIPVYIDSGLAGYDTIYPAAGTDATGVPMTFERLVSITGGAPAEVVEEGKDGEPRVQHISPPRGERPMQIRMLECIEGAREARGIAVIIDVFRAFSTACYVFDAGAREIIPVGTVEAAWELREQAPEAILIGERGGRRIAGFDLGNSPSQAVRYDFAGRSVVMTTSAGTQGIVNAAGAEEIVTGSFVNAAATVAYIRARAPEVVSLVAMGEAGTVPTDEDTLCAEYLQALLEDRPRDYRAIVHRIVHERTTPSFLDLAGEESAPTEDLEYCLALDRFAFVLRVSRREGLHRLTAVKPV